MTRRRPIGLGRRSRLVAPRAPASHPRSARVALVRDVRDVASRAIDRMLARASSRADVGVALGRARARSRRDRRVGTTRATDARPRRARTSGGADGSRSRARARATDEREREIDAVTRKWGLEAGLWRVWKSGRGERGDGAEEGGASRMDMAKKLLKRYGSAYLATSISLSLISITVFYFLVAGGIDVAALLEKIGITVNATSEQFGTFALAYAAHKASSPIRFGPTVALTPLVARWMGKDVVEEVPPTDDE